MPAALADGLGVEAAAADAGDPEALLGAIDQLGPPEVLIYNAAVLQESPLADLTSERMARDWAVNVGGAVAAARHVAPGMVARGRGAILFTGGGLAHEPWPQWTSLAMGKAALLNFSAALGKELEPAGVTVATVTIKGIIEAGGPFDPDRIAEEYLRLAEAPVGEVAREVVFAPVGSDPDYNAP